MRVDLHPKAIVKHAENIFIINISTFTISTVSENQQTKRVKNRILFYDANLWDEDLVDDDSDFFWEAIQIFKWASTFNRFSFCFLMPLKKLIKKLMNRFDHQKLFAHFGYFSVFINLVNDVMADYRYKVSSELNLSTKMATSSRFKF